jgi:hypothetical protein
MCMCTHVLVCVYIWAYMRVDVWGYECAWLARTRAYVQRAYVHVCTCVRPHMHGAGQGRTYVRYMCGMQSYLFVAPYLCVDVASYLHRHVAHAKLYLTPYYLTPYYLTPYALVKCVINGLTREGTRVACYCSKYGSDVIQLLDTSPGCDKADMGRNLCMCVISIACGQACAGFIVLLQCELQTRYC